MRRTVRQVKKVPLAVEWCCTGEEWTSQETGFENL